MDWVAGHAPVIPAAAWSRLHLAAPAPLAGEISRNAVQARHFAKAAVAAHRSLGWIAAWTLEHEILITASADGLSWRVPLPLHANPITDESLLGLAVAPSGQILALYLRDHTVFACTSDNLTSWSNPVAILQGKPDSPPHVLGVQADGQGRWMLVMMRYQFADQLYTSADGSSWKVEQSSCEGAQASIFDHSVALDSFSDGRPALVFMGYQGRSQSILRYGLGDDRHWTLRDHSPPVAAGAMCGIAAAGDHLYEVLDQNGRGLRWQAGGEVSAAGGQVLPGEAYAIGHGPHGALLLVSAAGSWWAARDAASEPWLQEHPPLVSYERPELAGAPAAAAPVHAGAGTSPAPAASPVAAAPPAAAAPPSAPSSEGPAAAVGADPGTAPVAAAHHSLAHVVAGVAAVLIGLAVSVLTIVQWWQRRRGAAP